MNCKSLINLLVVVVCVDSGLLLQTLGLKKLPPCKEVFFFWTLNPWPSLETMQTHRDSLTVQGGAFTSSCWSGSGRSQGRITAAPCAPSLIPTFLSCSDLRLTFLHLFAAIKNRHLAGNGEMMCKFSNERENVIFLLVVVSSHILTDLFFRWLCPAQEGSSRFLGSTPIPIR